MKPTKPDLPPATWSDLANVRKPSLAVVIIFGISAATFLYLAYFTGWLRYWVLFAVSFVVAALEGRRWLRRRQEGRRLVTRSYTDLDYQALGITPPRKKGRTRSQKVVGVCITIGLLAISVYLHTANGVEDTSSVLGAVLPLIMIVLDYNAVRFTWREIKGQWFRLAVYGLSVLLFLYHVLAFAGVFSIPRLIPDHMDELRFYVEATLALAFAPLVLLNIGIVVRDSWRQTFGKPL